MQVCSQKMSESWTTDVLEYSRSVLDEMKAQDQREASKGKQGQSQKLTSVPSEKWAYMVRLISWHLEEGILDVLMTLEKVLEWMEKDVQVLLLSFELQTFCSIFFLL